MSAAKEEEKEPTKQTRSQQRKVKARLQMLVRRKGRRGSRLEPGGRKKEPGQRRISVVQSSKKTSTALGGDGRTKGVCGGPSVVVSRWWWCARGEARLEVEDVEDRGRPGWWW